MRISIQQTMILMSFVATITWGYSGGTGKSYDPYQIAMAEDLIALGNDPCNYDKHFILTADIDLSGYVFDRAVIAPGYDQEFSGFFDGCGHVISHLSIQGGSYLGLFGNCSSTAIVINLGMEDVEINGNTYGSCIGGLAGYNSGMVTGCYSTGVISGKSYVGGLVGYNRGTVKSSYSTGTVMGTYAVGGLVGDNSSGIIANSYSVGGVTGEKEVGGLVGDNYSGTYYGVVFSSFWDVESSGQSISAGGTGLTTVEMQTCTTYTNVGWDLADETADGTCDFWIVHEGNYPRLAMFSGYSPAEFRGSGTQEDPYLLTDANELGTVWRRPWAYYRLDSDIDLTGIRWNSAVVPDFAGGFDGNGYVIRHVYIEGYWNLGLFGYCRPQANIVNLGLEDVEIIGEPNSVDVGGLVGINSGTVISCNITGAVSGSEDVGCLAGYNTGLIISSYSAGAASGIEDVGGLVGYNGGSIISSYSTEVVSGTNRVGGFLGYNHGMVTSCYSTANASSINRVGGFVGSNNGSITSSYSTGAVNGTDVVGGFVAVNSGWVNVCCWDIETSGQATSADGLGLSTAEMKASQTYIDAGWDLVNESTHGTCNYWVIENQEYPRLAAFSGWVPQEPYGHGTADDPYLITDVNELGTIWYRPQAHYCLETNLDLSGMAWNSAVIPGFSGYLEGQDHVINDLQITGGGFLGLFGECLSTATVANLVLEAMEVNGVGDYIGGFAGRNEGVVTLCTCSGNINGDDNVIGGLMGLNSGTVSSCHSKVNVNGDHSSSYYVGGLVGYNDGPITSCRSEGDISGKAYVGGLAGINRDKITASHSNAVVNGINRLGGLVGENDYLIRLCYSTGGVSGENRVGGLVGYNWGWITSSHSTGAVSAVITSIDSGGEVEVSGGSYAGGLIGENEGYGPITSCYSTGSVNGDAYVGGLVGGNLGPISSCYSTSSVDGTECVGGLVGRNKSGSMSSLDGGLITLSYSTGTVNGDVYTGGLVGLNFGVVSSSYSTGSVSGDFSTGGFVGENVGSSFAIITSCYSTGDVSGTDFVGGFVGYNAGNAITSCYSVGVVSGTEYVGGLLGLGSGQVISCFWDIETSGLSRSSGGRGRRTEEMQDVNTFLDEGWDFVDENQNGIEDTWFMPTGNYPGLTWSQSLYRYVPDVVGLTMSQAQQTLIDQGCLVRFTYRFDNDAPNEQVVSQSYESGTAVLTGTTITLQVSVTYEGSGTEEDPYQMSNAGQLIALGRDPNLYDLYYIQTADIDLSGYTFDQAVIAPAIYVSGSRSGSQSRLRGDPFTGSFNGQGHVISNVNIEGEQRLGLFGWLGNDAVITNLGLEAVNIHASDDCVGALAGFNEGTITSCYSTGTLSGRYVGGLVGDNTGTVLSSYSAGTVIGTSRVGGFVGYNQGTITSSYSIGPITGDDYLIGGFVGYNKGAITSSYSIGPITAYGYDIGGFVGDNKGTIMSSYSIGSITAYGYDIGGFVGYNKGAILSSFWDVDTSGWSSSDGGTGLTTSQLKNINTYLDSGWDFENETLNGTEDTWFMPIGSYPGLSWSQDRYPTMSDVMGLDAQEAQTLLIAQGHSVTISYQFSPAIPDGQVLSQTVEYVGDTFFEASVTLVVSVALHGMGTEGDPYQIANTRQLILLGETPDLYDQCFVMTEDLDLSDMTFARAVIAPDMNEDSYQFEGPTFRGSFDGQGHVISQLVIDGASYLGLFGCCSSESILSNLSLEFVDVNGTDNRIGALVAQNSGAIMNCQSNGSIGGYSLVGGLVGHNQVTGTISWCHTGGTVTGQYYTNSIAGKNEGSLIDCTSTAIVDGSPEGGGRR